MSLNYQFKNSCGNQSFKVIDEEKVTLYEIQIDDRLNFAYHVNKLIKKGQKRFHALTQVSKYINTSQCKLITNAFILSHFSYCPLI